MRPLPPLTGASQLDHPRRIDGSQDLDQKRWCELNLARRAEPALGDVGDVDFPSAANFTALSQSRVYVTSSSTRYLGPPVGTESTHSRSIRKRVW